MIRSRTLRRLPGAVGRGLVRLTYVALACRFLVPSGFMPASLADGGPIVICHGGTVGRLFASLAVEDTTDHRSAHSQSHHQDGDSSAGEKEEYDVWEHCPLGNAFGTIGPAFDVQLSSFDFRHVPSIPERRELVSAFPARFYRARAPPIARLPSRSP